MQSAPKPEMRNLMLAIVLSTAVLLGWQFFIEQPKRDAAIKQAQEMQKAKAQQGDVVLPTVPAEHKSDSAPIRKLPSRSARLESSERIRLDTGALHGSINRQGLRLDDLTLANYRQTIEPDSKDVVLLSPAGGVDSYLMEFGWLPASGDAKTPTAKTEWDVDQKKLTAGETLKAKWDNGEGLKFEQSIEAKDTYLFAIEQRVTNSTDKPVTLYPYGLISRTYADTQKHYYILHEGPIGVMDQTLTEIGYETLREEGKQTLSGKDGWIGITDKYWLSAMIPAKGRAFTSTVSYVQRDGQDRYQVDYRSDAVVIQPGETASISQHVFAGAKEVTLLDRYAAELSIPLFDRAVDFGMLYFLTKPIFHALNYFFGLLGNFGLAIMLLTVCIKLMLFPLANKSYAAMSQLKLLMPKITEIKERFNDDKIKMNQEIMELYKREKVNPASGCLPMLLQIPVFFALYKVLFVTIEMRHAPFYGWVQDLSAPDPTTLFNLFGLIDWTPPHFLMIGAWPLIMCLTMVIQQRLNPKPTDPAQAMVMQWLPYLFLFLFASFPAGLVIYWAWNNSLSILQQWVITRRFSRRSANG